MMIERVYRSSLAEPLKWIVLALFQPTRFRATCEPAGWRQRARMLARLTIPVFLLSYLLVIILRTVLLPAHLVALPDETGLLPSGNFLVPVVGVAFGLAWGLVFGTARGVAFGIVISLTAGVVFGLPGIYALLYTNAAGAWLVPVIGVAAGGALGLTFGLAWGVAFGVIVGLAAGLGIAGPDLIADFIIGLGFSLALTVRGGFVTRLEISLVVGLILGVIGGLTAGVPGGLASGLAAGLGSILGLSRTPWYLGSAPSAMNAQERPAEDLDLRENDRG